MEGNPTLRRAPCIAALLAVLCLAPLLARAEDGPDRTVPDVRRFRLDDARRRLAQAGLEVGAVYEISTERILRTWKVRYPVGYVWMQNPAAGRGWPAGKAVSLMVSATKDGQLPPGLPGVAGRTPSPAPRAPGSAAPPEAGDPRPEVGSDGTSGKGKGEAAPPPPPPPAGSDRPGPAPTLPAGSGSPDAPKVAPRADPDRVPEMVGLSLSDAEQLVRDSKMKLHVERVPGHPVGRVLEQVPAAGASRPPAGLVKVVVTAGGDFAAQVPGAPAVYVPDVAVPSLLDRTQAQAERIIEDLGLAVHVEAAKRGLPGRVVDQTPAGGGKVPRGGLVRIWIGPGHTQGAPGDGAPDGAAEPPAPGPLPAGPAPGKGADAPREPAAPAPKAPLEPGPLPGGVPQPVSPGAGTSMPQGTTVPVGFTWKGVQAASAYILEVEEQGDEGRWLSIARKPARTTAVLLDVERLDPKGTSRLRWRVSAIVGGRQGSPSRWVPLR